MIGQKYDLSSEVASYVQKTTRAFAERLTAVLHRRYPKIGALRATQHAAGCLKNGAALLATMNHTACGCILEQRPEARILGRHCEPADRRRGRGAWTRPREVLRGRVPGSGRVPSGDPGIAG